MQYFLSIKITLKIAHSFLFEWTPVTTDQYHFKQSETRGTTYLFGSSIWREDRQACRQRRIHHCILLGFHFPS